MHFSLKSRLLAAALPVMLFAPTAAASAQDLGSTIETVVVTASRRAESAQNVGGGLTAFNSVDLQQMHAHSFTDFATSVPSLSFASGGPTTDLIAIRGVTSGSAQKGSAVGIYLDDVPIGSSTQFGIGSNAFNFNLFDMQRVEVLDGPQGTLYGANSLGGAIKYVTVKPELGTFDAMAEAEGSSTEHGSLNDGLRAMVNVPLFGDKVAVRIDGMQEFDSGYTQDPAHHRKDVGAGRTLGGRVQMLAQLSTDLDVRLTAMTQYNYGSGADVVFRDFTTHQPLPTFYSPTGAGTYNQYYALEQPSEKRLNLYSAVANWDLHWAKLTSVTSYQYNYFHTDADVTPLYDVILGGVLTGVFGQTPPPFALPTEMKTTKFTQELRLASPDNKNFEWVVGGFYTRELTNETIELVDGSTANGQIPGTQVPGYTVLPFYGYLPSTYRELAVFGDGTYYVTDNFDVTLGLRYSTQHQTYSSYLQTLLFFPNYYQTTRYPATGNRTSDQSVVTYLINPRYHINKNTMLYARVSSGYRPGGPNFVLNTPTNAPPTFAPDKLWNYEIGEKSTLLDGKAILNFDLYDIEWSGIQTTASIGGINQLVNAGNARVQGAETSFSYRILPPLTVSGSASYTDAHLTSLTAAETSFLGITTKGARLPLSPRYNFALSGTYNFDLTGDISGALNISDIYVGSRNSAFNVGPAGQTAGAGAPNYKLAAYNTVNVGLSVFLPHNMEVDAYLKNVFDTRGEVSANPFENQYLNPNFLGLGLPYAPVPVMLSQPRTIGLVLKIGLDK